MILAVGANHITLKRIMRDMGFPVFVGQSVVGAFNTSYVSSALMERVPASVRSLPMINKNLIANKMNAVGKMKTAGLEENIADMSIDPQHEGSWIQKPFASQAGAGITRYVLGAPIPWGYYIQRDVVKHREFRAHVGLWLENPVFTIQEKKPKPELWQSSGLRMEDYEWPTCSVNAAALPVTWNIESGFYFRRSTTPENRAERISRWPLFERVEKLAIKAVKAIGYQYGAVDILMNESRELFVTEVNSHPAIKNEDSINIYRIALEPLKTISQDAIIRLVSGTSGTTTHTLTRRVDV